MKVFRATNDFIREYIFPGLDIAVKNAVYHELCNLYRLGPPSPIPPSLPTSPFHSAISKEPLAFVREAQREWEETLRLGINSLATELAVPLVKEVGVAHPSPAHSFLLGGAGLIHIKL